MEHTVLLGFTKDNEIVFGNVGYRNGMFTASFDTSYPQEITRDYLIEQVESMIECSDKDWVLDRLESYDCKPSELAEYIFNDNYSSIEELIDISLYPESFSINGVEDDIYFLASACGQHDTRGYMETYINSDLYDKIHELWDKYHLKQVDFEEVEQVFVAIEHQNNTIDEYKVVENWLQRNFK
jgi:hypothetical protein